MRHNLVRAALLLIILLAFALRVYGLGISDLWGDEAASYAFSRQHLLQLLTDVATDEPHPPLYYSMLHFWIDAFGKGNFILRFPSLWFGAGMVPLGYVLGRRLTGWGGGLAVAILLALHPFQIWYSQEVRMYGVAAFLGLLSTVLYLRLARGERGWLQAGYVVVSVLALLSHYYAAFILLFHNMHFLFFSGARSKWRRWLLLQGLVTLLFLPWPLVAWRIFVLYRKILPGKQDFLAVLRDFAATSASGWTMEPSVALLVALALIPLLLQGAIHLQRAKALSLPLLYVLVPLLAGIVFSLFRPAFDARYLFIVAPGVVLVLAAGLAYRPRYLPITILSIGLLAWAWGSSLHNLYVNPLYRKGGYSALTRAIAAQALPGDAVILNGVSQVYLYEYYKERDLPLYFLPPVTAPEGYGYSMVEDLCRIAAQHDGLWLLMAGTADYDPEGVVKTWLDTHAYPTACGVTVDSGFCYYRSPPLEPLPSRQLEAAFGPAVRLLRFGVDKEVASGGVLKVDLLWLAIENITANHKVFLHLRDFRGILWAQNDGPPVNGLRPTFTWRAGEELTDRRALRLLPGTPPGRYRLVLGIYDEATGQRLPVVGGTELSLATVEVTPTQEPLQKVPAAHRLDVAFEGGLCLLGCDLSTRMRAGEPTLVRLYWQAKIGGLPDYQLAIGFRDKHGHPVGDVDVEPLSSYPSSRWRPGEVVAGAYLFIPSPQMEPGEYLLGIAPRTQGGTPQMGSDGWFELPAPIQLRVRHHSYQAPSPHHEVGADLGELARLVGYDLGRSEVRPGETIALTIHWRALTETEAAYAVFVHLVDAQGRLVSQHDGSPASGAAPTTSWVAGEFIADAHEVLVPPLAAPGDYQLIAGLYEPKTGRRLRTPLGGDGVTLTTVRVVP